MSQRPPFLPRHFLRAAMDRAQEGDIRTADGGEAKTSSRSIYDQYDDGLCSAFVESPRNATLYEDYYHHTFLERVTRWIISRAGDGASSSAIRILDVGCGNCILGRKILRVFTEKDDDRLGSIEVQVTGIDVTRTMLEEGRRLCEAEGFGADDISLHLNDLSCIGSDTAVLGTFDFVISGFFLAHADTEDTLNLWFDKISSFLKPGGKMLHIVPLPQCQDESMHTMPADGSAEAVSLPLVNSNGKVIQTIELVNYHWTEEMHRRAAERAGLVDFGYDRAEIRSGSELTEDTLPDKVVLVEARKPF